jgi:hypothetical protein
VLLNVVQLAAAPVPVEQVEQVLQLLWSLTSL